MHYLTSVELLPLPASGFGKVGWVAGTVGLTAIAANAPGRRIGMKNAQGVVPIYGDVRAWAFGLGLGIQLLDLLVPLPYGLVRFAAGIGAASLLSLLATESMRVLDGGALFGMPLPALPEWLGGAAQSLPSPEGASSEEPSMTALND